MTNAIIVVQGGNLKEREMPCLTVVLQGKLGFPSPAQLPPPPWAVQLSYTQTPAPITSLLTPPQIELFQPQLPYTTQAKLIFQHDSYEARVE